jgi:hypothetical protein
LTLDHRQDTAALADCVLNRRTINQCRVNKAPRTLHQHHILTAEPQLLPNCKWIPFEDLPRRVRQDWQWTRLDYAALFVAADRTW